MSEKQKNKLSKKKSADAVLCCYCGIRNANTRDHIPPKAIFNKPRPSDLITVPCCEICNNGLSTTDEKFKVYLGIHVARQGAEAERLFKEGALATTNHNHKLSRSILQDMRLVYTTTESGIITGETRTVLWDSDAHDITIERITKGLYYHHFGKPLAKTFYLKPYWFNAPVSGADANLLTVSIGNGAFVYKYNKVDDMEAESIWLYSFYNGHFAGCITSKQPIE